MDEDIEKDKTPRTHLLFPRRKVKPVNKGVGGFRPVINWRDISYRRKRIADKQIMICVISSGIMLVILGIVLLIVGLLVIEAQCPFGWLETPNRCLFFSKHSTTWPEGRDLCISKGSEMLKFKSEEDTNEITQYLKGDTWIGLYRNHRESNFKWENHSPVSYTNWIASPSNTSPSFTECVQVTVSGEWLLAASCREELNVICMYKKARSALVLVGPIIVVCGFLVMVLSAEVCHRQRTLAKKGKILVEEDDREVHDDIKKESFGADNPAFLAFTPPAEPTSTALTIKQQSSILSGASQNTNDILIPATDCNLEFTPKPQAYNPSTLLTPIEEQSHSQEHLELLLTPKTLQ